MFGLRRSVIKRGQISEVFWQPEFPDARRDNGIAERLGISHVPALIALHPKSGKFIPLAYGMVSISEIEERVELLTKYPISVDHPYQVGDLIR